ncbi:MAG TPA: oligogalacturonate lyase family protein [Opitutaceae bacterium]|nr:oligogalacturonate lyase family protein [Opitutaceae bacterium]
MLHPARLLPLLLIPSLSLVAADSSAPSATPPAARGARGAGGRAPVSAAPASDWIDPKTGHRIIRLSPDSGGSSLYFHQHSYTPEGDKVVIRGAGGIATVDLSTLGKSPPKFEMILEGAAPIATAWRTREAYYVDRATNAMMAVNLDTKATRTVVALPPQARNGAYALNCDETLLVGITQDPDGKTIPRTPPPGGMGGSLEANWAAGTPKMIYTLNTKTGEFKVIHRENDWTNHLQCSPTDPQQILFCHEGPWHYNDRTWTIRADGGPARLLHERTMNMEIEGHEFFGQDGKSVWYDLQTPQSGVFWLAGVDLATGHRTWYNLQREEWSVHYNVSRDGKLFAGDGGGATSVAARTMDREPAQNGQWIYLFRPVMTKGSSFRDKKDLIDVGYFKAERLVDMSNHNYSKETGVEPNLTFTPDGKWIIFSGNFHTNPGPGRRATTHTYAVEIAKADKA